MITLNSPKYEPADPLKGWVPSLTFIIVLDEKEPIGKISLRLGHTDNLLMYGGQIGYYIDRSYWNQGYATQACNLLKAKAIENGFLDLWITCNPDNAASRRVCEKIGARLINIVDLPTDNDMYKRGERQKCRYNWTLIDKHTSIPNQ